MLRRTSAEEKRGVYRERAKEIKLIIIREINPFLGTNIEFISGEGRARGVTGEDVKCARQVNTRAHAATLLALNWSVSGQTNTHTITHPIHYTFHLSY